MTMLTHYNYIRNYIGCHCIRTFVFVLVALLLVKMFDEGFNGLTILNLLPTSLFVLHISGTAQMHCY